MEEFSAEGRRSLSLPQLASLRCYASSNPSSRVVGLRWWIWKRQPVLNGQDNRFFFFLTILFWKYELVGLWSGVLLSILIFVQIWGVIHLLEDVNKGVYTTYGLNLFSSNVKLLLLTILWGEIIVYSQSIINAYSGSTYEEVFMVLREYLIIFLLWGA